MMTAQEVQQPAAVGCKSQSLGERTGAAAVTTENAGAAAEINGAAAAVTTENAGAAAEINGAAALEHQLVGGMMKHKGPVDFTVFNVILATHTLTGAACNALKHYSSLRFASE